MDETECRRLLTQLHADLTRIVERDPEQEVRGIAIPVLDEAIRTLKTSMSSDPIVARLADVISVETIEAGEPVRALDVLMVVSTLKARMPAPIYRAPSIPRHPEGL